MIKSVLFAAFLCLWLAGSALAETSAVGVGSGAAAVDPSKNVLDSLLAAVTRLNDLLAAGFRRQDDLRDAETRRVDQLAAQKQVFDLELARGIRANADANALLLATQVRELKTDTSDRITKLEQFANEQRGRSSATDPAATQAYDDVRKLLAKQADTSGQGIGQSNMFGWIVAGLMLLVALAALFLRNPARVKP